MQDVFNKQVLDSHSVEASTIAGQGNAPGNILLGGEDDGVVSVDSVRYLRPRDDQDANEAHPGLQTALRPAYEREHMALIGRDSEALPRSLCTLYRLLYACEGNLYLPNGRLSAAAVESSEPAESSEVAAAGGALVPARGSVDLVLPIEQAASSTVVVSTGVPAVSGSIGGVAMATTNLLGVPALSAQGTGGATTVRLTNASATAVPVAAFATVATGRRLDVGRPVGPSRARAAVTVPVTLTGATGTEVVEYQVRDTAGTVVARGRSTADGGSALVEFVPGTAGAHSVDVWTEGASPRSASRVVAVMSATSRLGTDVSDRAVDEDGDGDLDALFVEVPVTVASAGTYRVAARLAGGQVSASAALARVELPAGPSRVTVRFSGRELGESRLDGPYSVVDATLATAELELLDQADLLGVTGSYAWRAFEHSSVRFDLAGFADEGVDADGDGLFEALRVSGRVTVDDGGSYAVNGRLVDGAGNELGEYQTTAALVSGSNSLELVFGGEAIGKSGADGPYRLVDLSVYRLGAQDALGYLVQAHSTQRYSNEQFVGSAITFPRLAAMLRSYAADGRLAGGTARSLLAKVEAAHAAAERGQPKTTANQLAAFVHELEALPSDKVSDDMRATLIKAARRLGGM